MSNKRQLGVFVKAPVPGMVKTRMVPPLSEQQACDLYVAFVQDLFHRLQRLKGTAITVFYAGGPAGALDGLVPGASRAVPQRGESLGERMHNALATLLDAGGGSAALIGSDSPDLPVQYVKRAFAKLKHKDVVLGPATDGGYYLVGVSSPARALRALFAGIAWSGESVLADTVTRARDNALSLATLPVWYDVDNVESLRLLRSLVRARRLEGPARLPATERVLETLDEV